MRSQRGASVGPTWAFGEGEEGLKGGGSVPLHQKHQLAKLELTGPSG